LSIFFKLSSRSYQQIELWSHSLGRKQQEIEDYHPQQCGAEAENK
jgi:hypothetical protein